MTERFELLERVGKGGMGVVWRARDGETGEIVALKLLHAIYAEEPDYVARFEREVEVARRIDSPHVVRVFGYGLREGVPYMAMEYVGGQSLRELIKAKGKLTWEEAKPLLRQVAEGLEAAHKAGVIHRDVKPSNILIAPDGTAKLADFGIARAADLTRLTGSSTMLGTPHYMAPEGEGTEAGDLYSLGCVLYEMLTGAPPFEGDSVHTIILRHLREEPRFDLLPPAAVPYARAFLQKDPSERLKQSELVLSRVRAGSRGTPGAFSTYALKVRAGPNERWALVPVPGGATPTQTVAAVVRVLGVASHETSGRLINYWLFDDENGAPLAEADIPASAAARTLRLRRTDNALPDARLVLVWLDSSRFQALPADTLVEKAVIEAGIEFNLPRYERDGRPIGYWLVQESTLTPLRPGSPLAESDPSERILIAQRPPPLLPRKVVVERRPTSGERDSLNEPTYRGYARLCWLGAMVIATALFAGFGVPEVLVADSIVIAGWVAFTR